MAKTKPDHPITDEQVAEFVRLVHVWQRRLHLMNWRIVKGRARPASAYADVRTYPEHRLARYSIGRDWGANPPDPDMIEKIVIHELMHIRLDNLLEAAFKERSYTKKVEAEEHDVILVFEDVLAGMSREIAELKAENAALKQEKACRTNP